VARYRADPAAVARFHDDTGLAGRIGVPVLSVHAVGDPTAFVELQSAFRETMERGGSASRLVQAYTDHAAHSYLDDPVYPAALQALLSWVDDGERPTPAALAARCAQMEATFGPGCRFVPDYRPAPLHSRVPAR
jgi:hypothetical protein